MSATAWLLWMCVVAIIICVIAVVMNRDDPRFAFTLGSFVLLLAILMIASRGFFTKGCPVNSNVESFTDPDSLIGVETLPASLTTKLEMYLSVLGTNSYKDGALMWNDISGGSVDRSFNLSYQPTYDEVRGGLGIRGVLLTGPQSHNLGILGGDDFTLYWYSTNLVSIPDGATIPVFTAYANTISNIGFRVSLQQTSSPPSWTVLVEENFDDGAVLNKTQVPLPSSFLTPSSFALVRSGLTFRVYYNDAPQGPPIACGDSKILLSNKNCVINESTTWDAKLSVVALYKRALTQADIASVTAYVQQRVIILSDEYQALLQQANALQQKAMCPLSDPIVCNVACASVTDWSSPTNFVQNAGPECLAAVNNYCTNNPTDPFCSCWSSANKDSAACQTLRSYFNTIMTGSSTKECDVRKLYPNSQEPSLSKYYSAVSPISLAAVTSAATTATTGLVSTSLATSGMLSGIKVPNDVVVNWIDSAPINQPKPIGGKYTPPSNVPSDKVVSYFGTNSAAATITNPMLSQFTANAGAGGVDAVKTQIQKDLASLFNL